MRLLSEFLALTRQWREVFPQQRTYQRAVRQAVGSLVCLGRRCLSRIIWTNGRQQRHWSGEYFLHSRCHWEPQQLFRPLIGRALQYCPQCLVGVALDDTRLRKTGRSIPQAFYQRDPMSPPFHVNLTLGLRFLQASVLLPLHRNAEVGARAVPVRFEEVSRVKRPGKKATEQMKKEYRAAVKQQNLSTRFVEMSQHLREEFDQAGAEDKLLALTGDGSFCNRTCFRQIPERSVLLVRARRDAKLCLRAPADSRRFYALDKFTPEQVRKDDTLHPWKTTKLFYGGKRRKVRYKVLAPLFWQSGARQMPLRLVDDVRRPVWLESTDSFYKKLARIAKSCEVTRYEALSRGLDALRRELEVRNSALNRNIRSPAQSEVFRRTMGQVRGTTGQPSVPKRSVSVPERAPMLVGPVRGNSKRRG
jgi:hypothetical protein